MSYILGLIQEINQNSSSKKKKKIACILHDSYYSRMLSGMWSFSFGGDALYLGKHICILHLGIIIYSLSSPKIHFLADSAVWGKKKGSKSKLFTCKGLTEHESLAAFQFLCAEVECAIRCHHS